eukprot:SAG31_NODE_47209_length_251_cov_0.684211_1_plen_43_part_10
MRESVQMWFAPPGAGVNAHMDDYCLPTLSIQLAGRTRWRISPP